jgi:hypothetical protein
MTEEYKANDRRWWLLDEPHEVIYETVVKLMNDDRATKYALWRELYEKGRSEDETEELLYCEQLTRDNLVANGLDTVHAKLTKSIPRPYFMTIGADWDASERADLMTKWMDGEAERLNLEELGSDAVKESATVGHVEIHYFECPISHRPAAELVYAEDVHVDPREAFFGCVRTKYRTVAVDREILAERYPKQRAAIRDSSKLPTWEPTNAASINRHTGLGDETSDMVLVVEAWRLPVKKFDEPWESGSREGRGRHVIVVADLTLFDEEWKEMDFPLVALPWVKLPRKYFGLGLAARLAGSQAEVNKMADKFYELADLAVPTYWVPAESEVNTEQMDNDGFTYHSFSGMSPPILLNPDPVAPSYMAAMQQRQSLTYSNNGISELGAKSEIPAQLQGSGRAMNVYSDIQTERFAVQALAIERFRVESAKRIVAIMERIVARAKDGEEGAESEALEALGGDRHGLEVIKYSDCRMGDTPYTVRCVPISKLSNQPSARLQEVDALIQMGLIGNEDALDLLDMHDLDRYRDITMAAKDDVKQAIQQCKRGKQPKAHSFMPLDYAITLGSQIYSLWHRKGAPDAVLTRLQTFIGMAQSLKQKQMEAMAPPPAPPAPMPPPMPGGGMPMDPSMMMGMPPGGMPPIPMPGAA